MAGVLLGLAALLLLLSATGGLAYRLGLTGIPAYILLGVAGGFAPLGHETVEFIQAIGVSLLLFFVGLEFSILRLRSEIRRLAAAGGIDLLVNFPLGLAAGLVLGWGLAPSLLLAAALYISSSAIVARNISVLRRAANPESEVALGILVAEDLIIAIGLAAFALWIPLPDRGTSMGVTVAAVAALTTLLTIGSGPAIRLIERALGGLGDEALLLGVSGLLLGMAGLALVVGLSEAIGAFVAGLLVGGSQIKERVEGLLGPFQGLFSALFFFAFGLSIDVSLIGGAVLTGLVLSVLAAATKLGAALWIGRVARLSTACRINLGFTLSPRGEFSVLVAAYGGAVGYPELLPLVAVVVVVLAVAGSLLTQAGPTLAAKAERWASRRGPASP